MKKIQKILELVNGEPTPFDVLSFEREWTQEELNALSVLEAIKSIKDLALQFNRTEAAVLAKYFEIRNELDGQIKLDVMFAPEGVTDKVVWSQEDYDFDELIKDVTVINAKVGDIVKVNVRTLIPFPTTTPVTAFYEVPESQPVNNMVANPHNEDMERWASITAEVINTGVFALGTEITGIRRSVLFIVEE